MTSKVLIADAARVGALRGYDILDTPRHSDFDEIVEVAAAICRTPIAIISLVDADRQWFKAEVGMGSSGTPIENSICAHVMTDDNAIVEIADTLLDPRTRDNPLCVAVDGLRFYAGALLKSSDGHVIGSLCVIDHRPRVLDDVQRRTLAVLASQVMAQIEIRAALRRETVMRRETDHRVKNSLASVASFVRLRQHGSSDPAAREDLRAVGQQIDTVELLHRQLSYSDTADTVGLGDYLHRLTQLLDATVPGNIAVTGDYADAAVSASGATAIGTIVNELVANAIKHGFELLGEGRVELTGHFNDGRYRLVCQDDAPCRDIGAVANPSQGQGPGGNHALGGNQGLGLRIIAALVKQIGGTVTRAALPDGFRTSIVFPVTTTPMTSGGADCSVAAGRG